MANLPRHPVSERNQNLTDIVKDYFRKGYMYPEMLEFLKVHQKKKKKQFIYSQTLSEENVLLSSTFVEKKN